MLTGLKRIPRNAGPEEMARLGIASGAKVSPLLSRIEEWLNCRYPVLGTIVLMVPLILIFLEITEAATNLNKYLFSY